MQVSPSSESCFTHLLKVENTCLRHPYEFIYFKIKYIYIKKNIVYLQKMYIN
jgi:hypothetical protein